MIVNKITSFTQNLNMFINHFSKNLFNEKKFYKTLNKDKLILFDVGSNLGSFINYFIKHSSTKNLEIHSFEPNKEMIKIQEKKFRNYNIHFNESALGNKVGYENLYISKISSQSTLKDKSSSNEKLTVVKNKVGVDTLDKYTDRLNIEKIDFLKIDCEGTDLEVLQGGLNLLRKNLIQNIKIEVYFFGEYRNFNQINKLLVENNYNLIGMNNLKYIKNKIIYSDFFYTSSENILLDELKITYDLNK